jgi:hypothetical protein
MSAKPSYLITTGITNLLETRYGLILPKDVRKNIQEIETDYVRILGKFLGRHFTFDVLNPRKIEGTLRGMMEKERDPVVCLDDVFFRGMYDQEFSVTRLTHPDTGEQVIGPRSGKPSIEYQVNAMAEKFSGRRVALLDIGIFHGDTLLNSSSDSSLSLAERLRENNVDVGNLYLGVANEPFVGKFEKAGMHVRAAHMYDFSDAENGMGGDWIEVRDLLGFDGRKPYFENLNGSSSKVLFTPYTVDKKMLEDKASIPPELADFVMNLSSECARLIRLTIEDAGFSVTYGPIKEHKKIFECTIKPDNMEGC